MPTADPTIRAEKPGFADRQVCPRSLAGRQTILRHVFEHNLGIAGTGTEREPRIKIAPARCPGRGRLRRAAPGLKLIAATLLCLATVGLPPVSDRGDRAAASAGPGDAAPASVEIAVPPPATPPPADTRPPAPPGATASNSRPAGAAATAVGLLPPDKERPLAALFGLNVQTIVLDPGHGGVDPGAIGVGQLQEKDLTLDVAQRLAALLRQEEHFRVLLTRDTDETVALSRRVAIANAAAADLFVSIHANALANSRANAVETYYFGAPPDRATWRLAEQENSDSGMAMGAFKALIGRLGDTLKQQESLALARSIQTSLLNVVMHRSSVSDATVKVAPFVVLLGVEAPSVLAEITCISSTREADRLATPEYRGAIAAALAHGIVAYVGARNPRAYGGLEHEQGSSEGTRRGEGNG